MPPKKTYKPPKTLGACADRLYTLRRDRLKLTHEAEEYKAEESQLKDHVIATLPKSEASGVAGKLALVKIETKQVPQVEDWDAFYKHVRKTGEFDLMGRMLSKEAVEARLADGKKVPGVKMFPALVVSVTKV